MRTPPSRSQLTAVEYRVSASSTLPAAEPGPSSLGGAVRDFANRGSIVIASFISSALSKVSRDVALTLHCHNATKKVSEAFEARG